MSKMCKKCGQPFAGRMCKPCKKEYDAKRRADNLETIKQSQASAYQRHRAERIAASIQYHAVHPEVGREAMKRYRAINGEKIKNSAASYRASHPEKCREWCLKWLKKNPGAKRAFDQNRRARKANNGGVLSKGLASRLFALQKGKCACCGVSLGEKYHMDHIIPLALGGANSDSNIQLLRATCNCKKQAKHPVDYMQERGFLL